MVDSMVVMTAALSVALTVASTAVSLDASMVDRTVVETADLMDA